MMTSPLRSRRLVLLTAVLATVVVGGCPTLVVIPPPRRVFSGDDSFPRSERLVVVCCEPGDEPVTLEGFEITNLEPYDVLRVTLTSGSAAISVPESVTIPPSSSAQPATIVDCAFGVATFDYAIAPPLNDPSDTVTVINRCHPEAFSYLGTQITGPTECCDPSAPFPQALTGLTITNGPFFVRLDIPTATGVMAVHLAPGETVTHEITVNSCAPIVAKAELYDSSRGFDPLDRAEALVLELQHEIVLTECGNAGTDGGNTTGDDDGDTAGDGDDDIPADPFATLSITAESAGPGTCANVPAGVDVCFLHIVNGNPCPQLLGRITIENTGDTAQKMTLQTTSGTPVKLARGNDSAAAGFVLAASLPIEVPPGGSVTRYVFFNCDVDISNLPLDVDSTVTLTAGGQTRTLAVSGTVSN